MRIHLLTYANVAYRYSQRRNAKSALLVGGFDSVTQSGPGSVPASYRHEHQRIFDIAKGDGLWLWKPYLILQQLELLPEGAWLSISW